MVTTEGPAQLESEFLRVRGEIESFGCELIADLRVGATISQERISTLHSLSKAVKEIFAKSAAVTATTTVVNSNGGHIESNGLRKAPSAYSVFLQDFKKDFQAKDSSLPLLEVIRLANQQWKTTTKAEKAPYAERAKGLTVELKERGLLLPTPKKPADEAPVESEIGIGVESQTPLKRLSEAMPSEHLVKKSRTKKSSDSLEEKPRSKEAKKASANSTLTAKEPLIENIEKSDTSTDSSTAPAPAVAPPVNKKQKKKKSASLPQPS